MKKLMMIALIATSMTAFGQSSDFGLKGGFNYGATGDLTDFSGSEIDSDNKLGFHLGAFGKFQFSGLFLQPEVVFTQLNSEYESGGESADYKVSKLDVPVLLGINIIGPLNIKAGPSFQYILSNTFEADGLELEEDPENSITLGYQVGLGVSLGRLGLDLRYESGFSENDSVYTDADIQEFGFTVDNRPSQWILSLSYLLGE